MRSTGEDKPSPLPSTKNKINYDNRFFASIQNSASGEVSPATVFHYHQTGDLVWAEYKGGAIVFGSLIAKPDDAGNLEMRYQHLNKQGELMTGKCFSTPQVLPDSKILFHEKWQWTRGDFSSGEAVIQEIVKSDEKD